MHGEVRGVEECGWRATYWVTGGMSGDAGDCDGESGQGDGEEFGVVVGDGDDTGRSLGD